MSADRIVSGTEVDRVRPYTFERSPSLPAPSAAATALNLEQEIERRGRELADQLRDEARRQGIDEGAQAVRTEMYPALEALNRTIEVLGRSTEEALDDLARGAVVAGIAVAEAVVGKRLQDDPKALLDPVARAVRELDGDPELVVHLNPADAAILRQAISDATPATGEQPPSGDLRFLSGLRITDDHTIERGNCRVQSALRIAIDGLYKRLDDIREAVSER